jgi:hypothetical protein
MARSPRTPRSPQTPAEPARSGTSAPPISAPDSSDPAVPPSKAPPVLDASGAGAPVLSTGPGAAGTLGIGAGTPPAGEDLIVEVEFVPGAASLGSALVSNLSSFLAGGDTTAPKVPASSGLTAVLQRFNVKEARPVHTSNQVQADEARISAMRQAAAMDAAPLEQASALERLPSLASFVRLRFPAGTPSKEVTDALKRLPEVARAVRHPGALPPMLAVPQPLPSDPLIGSATGPLLPDPNSGLVVQ